MPLQLLGNIERGRTFIVSAPAGTGKTTLIEMLKEEFPCVIQSVSFTTRAPRQNEIDGVHYNFIDENEFKRRIEGDEFLEYVQLYGDFYGTSKKWLEEKLSQGKHVVLVIDTQGAKWVKKRIEHTSIFVMPPSLAELRRRITERRTESDRSIEERLKWAEKEIDAIVNYDYLIVNDDLSVAYGVLRSIFIAEEHRIAFGGGGSFPK